MNRTQRPGSVPPTSVFLDPSGRRKQWSRLLFRLTVAGFALYVGLLAASLIRDPRLGALGPSSPSGDLKRRLVYRPPTGPSADSQRKDQASSVTAAAVPDYAAALGGITVSGIAPSRREVPAPPAPGNSGPAEGAAPPDARPGTVTVTTTIRSSDWPVATVSSGGRPTPTAPTSPPTTSPGPSGAPPTTTTTTATTPAPAPQPTTTTTTSPDPAPTGADGRGPDSHGPPGLLRKTASQPTS